VTRTTVDPATGDLLVAGKRVFPIGLSDPPPVDGTAPGGGPAWAAIAAGGVTFFRHYGVWTAAGAAEQLIEVGRLLQAASQHGLQLWLALAGVDNDLSKQALLDRIVNTVKGHPGLGAWKGADEPAHGHVPAAGCVAVYRHLKTIDPDHPVVLIEAPRGPSPGPGTRDTRLTAAQVRPYAPACDVHGIDIYPVSKPPGLHAGGPPVNTDISVVGDMTRLIRSASPGKPAWTTLQISWSGAIPPHPIVFPTFVQARFMAYDAIIAGARGLFFFGGHIKASMNAADRQRGWNWTYWQDVLHPLLQELTDGPHMQALTAPISARTVKASAADVRVSTREAGGFLHVLAARTSARLTGPVRFTGLPAGIRAGTVLGHPGGNPPRPVRASAGAFTDPSPFAPHNARVYRFSL
jgi:hypothetical protein